MNKRPTWATGKRRLLKLAEFLSKLPRKRFHYGSWVGNDWKGKEDLSCGTTACALGWATTLPLFRRLGLRLNSRHTNGMLPTVILKREGRSEGARYVLAEKLFGITESEFQFLFYPTKVLEVDGQDFAQSPSRDATPKQVAAHIRRFIRYKDNGSIKYPKGGATWLL